MPPGASLLMRGLGMRDTERYIKNKKPGRGDLGNFNRPRPFLPDGDGGIYPMPLGAHGNRDEDIALLPARYLDGHQGSLGGLSDNYGQSLFEYERSRARRQGRWTSRFRGVRPRSKKDLLEFQDWLSRRPDRDHLEAGMARDASRGCFIFDQDPYRRRRGDSSHKRPQSHRHGFFDIGDPSHRPSYPGYEMHRVPRGGGRPPFGTFPDYRDINPHRHPATGAFPTPRGSGRRTNHAHGFPGNHARHVPFDRPLGEFRLPKRTTPHRPIYPDFDPRTHPRNPFVPPFPPPHHRHFPDGGNHEDELGSDVDENDDTSSLNSTHSFIRRPPSPRIVYSHLPPYFGHPLAHNDEDDVDHFFSRRAGHRGHRRGLGRHEGGQFRFGSRSGRHGREGDFGFSGDEDEDEAYGY